jgi:DNA-binding LacI/PurR family transcriptional regulator
MQVTRLQDIAERLNISKVAVSKALNNHKDISDDLKKRVKQMANEMGYIPNHLAKNFKSKKSFTIGVLVPSITNSYFSKIVTGIIEYFSDYGYTPIILISNEDPEVELINIEKLYSIRVDGLLICITKHSNNQQLSLLLNKIKLPIVFFDRIPDIINMPSICSNQEVAAYDTVNLLINKGYSEFAFIGGPEYLDISKKRINGFLNALKDNKIKINDKWIKQGELSKDSGEKDCMDILNEKIYPEILFCINDEVAYGAYKAIYSKGLKIPEDIGVLAFGHQEYANYMLPKLSIIEQYPQELGNEASKILLRHIEKKTKSDKNEQYFKTCFTKGDSIIIPKT